MTVEQIGEWARANKIVRIEYQKMHTGEIKSYWIEPYSMRDSFLFGFDRNAGHIKKFQIGNVIDAQETDETFTPQFPVEF